MLGQEAAFGGVGDVAVGQQVAFSRLRIRIDDLPPGASYHVTTPYGERDVVADDRRPGVRDRGPGLPRAALRLRGRSQRCRSARSCAGTAARPRATSATPNVEHTVVGSPTGDNFFRVEGAGHRRPGRGRPSRRTCSPCRAGSPRPRATVDLPGDLYAVGTPGPDHAVVPRRVRDRLHDRRIRPTGPAPRRRSYTSTADDPAATVTLPGEDGAMTLKYARASRGPDQRGVHRGVLRPHGPLGRQRDPWLPRSPRRCSRVGRTSSSRPRRTAFRLTGPSTTRPTGPVRVWTAPATRWGRPASSRLAIPVTRTTVVTALSVPDATAQSGRSRIRARFRYVIHNLRDVSTEHALRLPGHAHRHRPAGRPGRAQGGPRRARAVPRRPAVPGRRRPAGPDPRDLVPGQLPGRVLLVVR